MRTPPHAIFLKRNETVPNDEDWNRWRGEISAQMQGLHAKIDSLSRSIRDHIKDDDRHFSEIYKELNSLRMNVTRYSIKQAVLIGGIVLVAGVILPKIIDKLM